MKWLAKRSLFNLPFIGWSMRLVKDVPIDRASPSAAKAALDECATWLERGVPVMIFPEGTRSKTGEMQSFKTVHFAWPSTPAPTFCRWPSPARTTRCPSTIGGRAMRAAS